MNHGKLAELFWPFLFAALALIFGLFLGTIVIFIVTYMYKLDKRYKRRKYMEDDDSDDLYFTHRGQQVRYQDPSSTELKYIGYRQTDPDKVNLIQNQNKPSILSHNNGPNNIANAVSKKLYSNIASWSKWFRLNHSFYRMMKTVSSKNLRMVKVVGTRHLKIRQKMRWMKARHHQSPTTKT